MQKLIPLILLLGTLATYYQLDCTSFLQDPCGGYNSPYKLKCHKFGTSDCHDIQVDEGCYYDSNHNCEEESGKLADDEICYEFERYKCRRIKDQCTSFKDTTCGGHIGIEGQKQSVKLSSECSLIDLDNFCEVKNNLCSKKSTITGGEFDDAKEICGFIYNSLGIQTACKKRNKVCSDQSTTNCNGFTLTNGKTCSKVYDSYTCKEVTIDEKCQISNGYCTGKTTLDTGKICVYNSDNTACQPRNKVCSDQSTTNCNGFTLTNGKTCSLVYDSNKCKEVTIDEKCQISNGYCTGKTTLDTDKICVYNSDNTACQPRNKVCREYNNDNCKNLAEANNLQCYYFSSIYSNCIEVEIDGFCHILDGKCVEKQNGSLNANEICAFSDYNQKCQKREKFCSDLNDDTKENCENYTPITKYCFKFEDEDTCKEVKIDDSCQMNSSNQCVAKGSLGKNEICTLDEKKDRCYKTQNGDAHLLKNMLLSVLLLFFIF